MLMERLTATITFRRLCLLLLVTFLLWTFATAQNQTTPSAVITGEKDSKIDALAEAYAREGLLSGAVLVAERGRVIYKRGFGYANMEFKVPNAPNTKFRIASITKSIVAVLAMRLVEKGKLSLDTRVGQLLPDYQKDIADKVTVRHLLSHTSGLPDTLMNPGLWEREIRDPFTPAELLARYSAGPLQFEPGTKFKYNSMSFVLLSQMIEKATAKSFEQNMRDEVLAPLGMNDTGFEGPSPTTVRNAEGRSSLKDPSPINERMATGYMKANGMYTRSPFMDMSHGSAGGAMYSTVEDLYRLDRGLHDDKFLSRETRRTMFTPVILDMGLAWNVRYLNFSDIERPFVNIVDEPRSLRAAPGDIEIAYKLGDLWGFSGVFLRLPRDEHAIFVLVNVNNRAVFFDLETVRITLAVINILYDKPYFTPRERSLAAIIDSGGYEPALAELRRLGRREPGRTIVREAETNILGRELLGQKKFPQAIGVFKLNVEAYPNSANAHDSLAAAYALSGDKPMAIKFYEKVLEILPNDPNADKVFLRNNALTKLKELRQP